MKIGEEVTFEKAENLGRHAYMSKTKYVVTARLENWFKDPDHNMLWGNIFEDIHHRWLDGHDIHTSYIVEMNVEKGYVRTLNSLYLLGKKCA